MSFKTTQKEAFLELLKDIADGKEKGFNPAYAQRWLKYLTKTPENKIELEIHKHFLQLCERRSTPDQLLINLWTEILENKLQAYCIAGEIPKKLDDIVHYKRILVPSFNFTISSSVNFLDYITELRLHNKFKEFLFKAKEINDWEENVIYQKCDNTPEEVRTVFMLSLRNNNLIIHHNPAINKEEVGALLRIKFYWWAIR